MMAIIAGAVITNIYCTQPILPLIASDLGLDVTTVDLVAGANWCWVKSHWRFASRSRQPFRPVSAR
jgi:hypothetical protein